MSMQQQFYRTSIVLGEDKVNYLGAKHVLIAGVGGIGGYVVEALARGGIGKITIVDHDLVDITNINRQIIALLPDVGKPKIELFSSRVAQINPECELVAKQVFIDKDNLHEIIHKDVDYVVDCIDTIASKLDLIEYCYRNKVKLVSAMGAGNKIDISQAKVADISKTSTCGLARLVRLRLRERGITRGVKVVYSTEKGESPLIQENSARPINGTVSYLPALFGIMLAGIVMKNFIDE